MGSGPSTAANDEKIAAQNISHFDHTYDAILMAHSDHMVTVAAPGTSGYPADLVRKLGPGRLVVMVMKFDKVEVKEQVERQTRTLCTVKYASLKTLEWDHSVSAVKLVVGGTRDRPDDAYVAFKVPNSLELESEAKLRLRGLAQQSATIALNFQYVGVYAGPTKPKPFQRKRANLSKHEQGKLPPLGTMRDVALARHHGSGAPTRPNQSKRLRYALDEIHKGACAFTVVNAQERGKPAQSGMLSVESKLVLSAGYSDVPGVAYAEGARLVVACSWAEVRRYEVWDRQHQGEHANGVELEFADGRSFFFVVLDVLQVSEAVEHFWNRRQARNGLPAMPKSTHGREVVKMTTLTGEIAAPPPPPGDLDVLDEKGVMVRPGRVASVPRGGAGKGLQGQAKRKATFVGTYVKGKKATDFRINPRVDKFWDAVVKHQGWLLKKGGVGVQKAWIKRYAVLYQTAMGHFLCYYADFAKSPLFHEEERERRVIDLCKTTFIRPVSNNPEAPTNSFDICTIEREWTLSAESKAAMQQWLQVITRAIDEDVAIVPDDELVFLVKPRVDPSGKLLKNEYSTALRVSASGVAVCHCGSNDDYQERFFWCYTDFFKWSILHHSGKTGLQVSVFTSTDFDVKDRQEFLFRTRDAVKLATAIEFYIEKFMAAMHLYLEGTPAALPASSSRDAGTAVQDSKQEVPTPAADAYRQMAAAQREMAQETLITEDLIGVDDNDDDDETAVVGAAPPTTDNGPSILDLFTVDSNAKAGAASPGDPFAPKPLHDPDDPFAPRPVTHPAFVKPDDTLLNAADDRSVVSELTVPPSVAPQAPVQNDADLLFGGGAAVVPEQPPLVPEEPPPPPFDAFAAGGPVPEQGAPVAGPVASEPVVVDATETMIAESPLYDALTRLCEAAGVLYENDAISIRLSQEYRGSQGRVVLTVRNDYPPREQGGHALQALEVELDLGSSGLRHHVADLSGRTHLEPGDEASVQLMLECMQPYDEAPCAVVKFVIDAQSYQLKIALPAVFTKFMDPVDLAPQVFVQRWATLGAPGLECMTTFQAKAGPATADFAKPRLETLVNLAFATGIDDSDGTILSGAAALKTGTANAGGDKISVGCLVRLEMNAAAAAYRLTVRTAVPRVSQSLSRAIIAVL